VLDRSWLKRVVLSVAVLGSSVAGAASELTGSWDCPVRLHLAAVGQSELTLQASTRSRLHAGGHYDSEGEAVVRLGPWPLTLAAASQGQWLRDGQQFTLAIETLELSPGSTRGVELQHLVIQQLTSMLPPLPHTETAHIVSEMPGQVVLEDATGERFTCSRR